MDGLAHQLAHNVLYCAQQYSCAVEDLLLLTQQSACNVIDSCVCERLSNEQTIQTGSLLQECIMVRDGLAHLPDVFTASDMPDIVRCPCMC